MSTAALPAHGLLTAQGKTQAQLLSFLRAAGADVSASSLSRYLCHGECRGFDEADVSTLICDFLLDPTACATSTPDERPLPEPTMLSAHAMQHYKIPRDPFVEDINEPDDVFFSLTQREVTDELRYGVNQAKFMAVIGESGAGKSTLALHFLDKLERSKSKVLVIAPKAFEKEKLTADHISEAIIAACSQESPRRSKEARAAQVERILQNSSRSGYKHVLLIEEAHKLHPATLKNLKGFWELRLGMQKLLAVVLIGQPELGTRLDEKANYDAREIIRRCQVVHFAPFTQASDVQDYLTHKFARAGANANVLERRVGEAVLARLRGVRSKGEINNQCHPQLINNLVALAINEAAENADAVVSAELVGRV